MALGYLLSVPIRVWDYWGLESCQSNLEQYTASQVAHNYPVSLAAYILYGLGFRAASDGSAV